MLKKYKDKREEGFTIVEVLIVLAIAGLIILIVFLAVPALQRNSRNTQRRNDVQAALGSFQEYMNNNNGQLPSGATAIADGMANAQLGFYDVTEFTGNLGQTSTVPTVTSDGADVIINNYSKCPDSVPAANTAAVTMGSNPTSRNVTAVFQVETQNGFQAQCLDM